MVMELLASRCRRGGIEVKLSQALPRQHCEGGWPAINRFKNPADDCQRPCQDIGKIRYLRNVVSGAQIEEFGELLVSGHLAREGNQKFMPARSKLNENQYESIQLAAGFSPSVFRALGQRSWTPALLQLEPMYEFARRHELSSLGEAFDEAFDRLARSYRNEYVYKNTIVSKIVFGRHSPRTASALLELHAGTSIADVVVFNGTSTVYEIKTDLDSLTRLQSQMSQYSEHFERCYLVTSFARSSAVLDTVPPYVGVIGIRKNGALAEIRPATGGLDRLSARAMFGLLRRDEVLRILEHTLHYTTDVPIPQLWSRTRELFETLPIDVAHSHTVAELSQRSRQCPDIAKSMPESLRARMYETPTSRVALARIQHALHSTL